jgi:hypothetical protein
MADQYTWEKANQASYKTTLQQLSRKTIADGQLLNNDVVETLSSRDKYINDNLTAETVSANCVFNTVKNNSATNWDNNLLSGFSAIQADSTKIIPANKNDTLNIKFTNITADVDVANNKMTIKFPEYFKDSYFQRTQRTSNPKMKDFPEPWGNNTSTAHHPIIFGHGLNCNDVFYNNISRMLVVNGDRVNSIDSEWTDGCISINPGTTLHYRGILINDGKNSGRYGQGIAINNSTQGHITQIAINDSETHGHVFPAFAMNSSIATTGAINFCSNNSTEMSLSLFNSTNSTVSIAAHKSSASNLSFASYNSVAGDSMSLSLYNAKSTGNFAYTLYNSSAHNPSIAMYNSTGKQMGVSLYNSIRSTDSEHTFAIYNSSAQYGKTVAAYNSYAGNGGDNFAIYNSTASGMGCCAALYDSTAAHASNLAMYNSTGVNGGNAIAIFNSITRSNEAFTMYNSDICNNNPGMALYNSKMTNGIDDTFGLIMFNSVCRDEPYIYGGHTITMHMPFHTHLMYNSVEAPTGSIKVYKQIDCGGEQEVLNESFMSNGIVKYNSRIAGCEMIVEYDSTACMGTSGAIVMYGSTLSSTEAHYQNDEKQYNTHGIIAMYDSHVTDDSDKIKLWSNSVTIEPSGYVNKIKYFDTTHTIPDITHTIPFTELAQLHSLTQFSDYHEIIIG